MASTESSPYRVLARKYRPRHFDELIGQDALVRTLRNAITSGRIAHAFMLTGVRGVGKTTTARIIAKALNYTGPDGKSGPTTGPTDDCAICQAIAEDRHPDVMEMDAASRTGIDDIREILDGVRYAPTSARYKIYIIDEVHMLSKAAFNALLKTLEEPPAHVKFIFATTEIRKVPVTVLSRCQRFDLRRVDADVLAAHFKSICEKESVGAEAEALDIIARAADGSVRDGLSLLDQAIALGHNEVKAEEVTRMLGLADRSLTLSLFAAVMAGHASEALAIMDRQHQAGGDPLVVLQDLLEITHDITLLRAMEARDEAFKHTSLPVSDTARCKTLARDIAMPNLQRAWAILLKGLQEAQHAPDAKAAAEMAVMRLIYAAELPDPARLIRDIQSGAIPAGGGALEARTPSVHSPMASDSGAGPTLMAISGGGGAMALRKAEPVMLVAADALPQPDTFEALVTLCEDKGEMLLASQLVNYAHPVRFEVGRFDFRPAPEAPANIAQRLTSLLQTWTGTRWMISISTAAGDATLSQKKQEAKENLRKSVLESPHVKAVLAAFPGAEIHSIKKGE
ncbi:MAG: DNA polymerase III subunit gamma/tau [Alphaproteobacteria bacterium]|nr:DNA polymerase III subunit gamma/tau [Alphaproteobacteria bacterium]